jgi:hypothetical protein
MREVLKIITPLSNNQTEGNTQGVFVTFSLLRIHKKARPWFDPEGGLR